MMGAAAGSPRPVPAVPCAPGSCTGDGRSIPVPGARVGPWGWLEGGAGGVSRLPGIADSVSSSAVLVLGFSLILHGSSTGSCDL